jgi:hypothetical protein
MGVTPRHSFYLRSALIECAWIAIRNDAALMSKYLNYRKRMNDNVAIVRIAKILLNRIVYVLRKKKKYERKIVK